MRSLCVHRRDPNLHPKPARGQGVEPPALDPATGQRLAHTGEGQDTARHLTIATLEPGTFGVLVATIVQVEPVLPYRRKAGGEGLRGRLRLADSTGEVELVLWDDETAHVRDGTFAAGRRIVLRGASVKPGYRGGIELGLRGARWDVDDGPGSDLVGPGTATARS